MKIREAVELLGGPNPVGKALGVKERTISDWMTKNKVSGPQSMAFYDLCRKYSIEITMREVSGK